MKRVFVTGWSPFETLQLVDVPQPVIGERDVLIEVRAAGISFATSLVVQGKYQRKPPLPFVTGTEVAGIVAAVGPGVTRFKPGDRVCAVLDWGGLAEYACAKEVNVFAIPDSLSYPRAIAFTNSAMLDLSVQLVGKEIKLAIPFTLKLEGDQLEASGAVELSHRQLGLKPFSALLGSLRVAEQMKFKYLIRASKEPK